MVSLVWPVSSYVMVQMCDFNISGKTETLDNKLWCSQVLSHSMRGKWWWRHIWYISHCSHLGRTLQYCSLLKTFFNYVDTFTLKIHIWRLVYQSLISFVCKTICWNFRNTTFVCIPVEFSSMTIFSIDTVHQSGWYSFAFREQIPQKKQK